MLRRLLFFLLLRLPLVNTVAYCCRIIAFLSVSYPQVIFALHSFVKDRYLWSFGPLTSQFPSCALCLFVYLCPICAPICGPIMYLFVHIFVYPFVYLFVFPIDNIFPARVINFSSPPFRKKVF